MKRILTNLEDLIGYKKDKIEVVGIGYFCKQRGKQMYEVKCHNCGNTFYQTYSNIMKMKGKGCKNCKNSYLETHGMKHERIYSVWREMKHRCNCTERDYNHYKNYGGRGIKVCDEWNKSFEAFRDWAYANGWNEENMYASGRNMLTIDRIDNDGNYCPENCRIITHKEQQDNKRTTNYLIVDGKKYTYKQLSVLYNLPTTTIKGRVKRGWTIQKILNTPRQLRRNII